jgi:hypothetical protein
MHGRLPSRRFSIRAQARAGRGLRHKQGQKTINLSVSLNGVASGFLQSGPLPRMPILAFDIRRTEHREGERECHVRFKYGPALVCLLGLHLAEPEEP